MKYWKKLSYKEQDAIITQALTENINFQSNVSLGIPASKLDPLVFHEHASFLKDAPLLRTYVQNPNHIGCHTFADSEPFFKGTQQLEKEVIELIAVDFLDAEEQSCDGYIASGGTEANIQAAWIYRNYFIEEHSARIDQIAIISSADTHYSVHKAANLLNIQSITVAVEDDTRLLNRVDLENKIGMVKDAGVKFLIVFANMATTMFGSVDDPDLYAAALSENGFQYKIHVDGAFGGFIFPVSCRGSKLTFSNPNISSVTLDAHKMLQAPYGTGIFISRKQLIQYVHTRSAKYVNGFDSTLSGSRSGTHAVAVWMILFTYGPYGWLEKINKLLYRTQWLCDQLDRSNISYYRNSFLNIVTIRAIHVPAAIAKQYGLVPDSHDKHPEWYKIVVMDHVELDYLHDFLNSLLLI